jgi:N,N'-diacetyllegionaminate synthase
VDSLVIAGREIGADAPCFIIAEAGVNHNGAVSLAIELIDAAVEAGADAVKFQTFKADALAAANAPAADYQRSNTAANTQSELLEKLELGPDDFETLANHAAQRGILFLSTAFDSASLGLLRSLGVPAFKVPSGELTNHAFLAEIARVGQPVLVSTGMADIGEVEDAIAVIRSEGNDEIVLLHCVSEYPAAPESANLRAMATMRSAFGVPVGYSDHTLGLEVPLAAAALGAVVIEKHLTTDRTLTGPDHAASLEPLEFTRLVRGVRAVESALGSGIKRPTPGEAKIAAVVRRSLVARRGVAKGQALSVEDLVSLRPGTGIPPSAIGYVIGRVAREPIPAGTVLSLDMLA